MSDVYLSTIISVASTCFVAVPLLACDVAEHDEFAGSTEIEQIEEEEDEPFLNQVGARKPGPQAALRGCYWEYAETSSSNEIRTDPCQMIAQSPLSQDGSSDGVPANERIAGLQTYPVSGGCHTDSDKSLKVSIPLEFDGSGIDDDEFVTNGYRWLCRFSGTPGSGTAHRAWALCCIP